MEIYGNSKIIGLGAFLPKESIKSDDLMHECGCNRFGTPENYISQRIGIIERRVAEENTLPSDMAIHASISALSNAHLSSIDLDLIIYCGIDRDWQEPATAHRVQVELGATRASCFDVTNACHGFMDGIAIANSFISTGAANNVLICTGEKQSETLFKVLKELKDTSDKMLFKRKLGALTVGDAGGAMVLQKADKPQSGLVWMQSYSEGKHSNLCYYKNIESRIEGQMLMKEISLEIIKMHRKIIEKTYSNLGWGPEEVNKIYCHQVGKKPHAALAKIASIDIGSAPATYPFFGNLTSATIPVNMYLNPPKKGEKLLLMGTGSGLTVCQAGMQF